MELENFPVYCRLFYAPLPKRVPHWCFSLDLFIKVVSGVESFFIQRGNRETSLTSSIGWRVATEILEKIWPFFFFCCFSLFDLKHIRWILVLLLSLNSEKPNVQSHLISLQQELTELVEQLLITCLYIKGLMAAEIMLLFLLM